MILIEKQRCLTTVFVRSKKEMFFFSGDNNNYSIYFYKEYDDDKKMFVKLIDHLDNYEVSEMVDYINNLRDSGPKDPSSTKGVTE